MTQPDDLTRYVEGPGDGGLTLTTARAGGVALQLTNLHGDVMAQVPVNPAAGTTGAVTVLDGDEFGNPTTTAAASARYGWLGAHQRSGDTLGDTILMGVRVYHPATGRFWQPDPVPGGGATPYDYCFADPVNCTDLDGRAGSWGSLVSAIAGVAEVASWIPGPIGAVAGGVSALAYASQGNWRKAGEMALTGAANLVGAGAVVRVGARIVSAAQRSAAGTRIASRATRAARARAVVRRGSCLTTNSFLPDTYVLMADGSAMPIGHLREGDLVAAPDPITGTLVGQPIVDVMTGHGDEQLVRIWIGDSSQAITATANHPMWADGKGWTPAADLANGDIVQAADGERLLVRRVQDLGLVADTTVINLTVGGPHTFAVVTDSSTLTVHNAARRCGNITNDQAKDIARFLGYRRVPGSGSAGGTIFRG